MRKKLLKSDNELERFVSWFSPWNVEAIKKQKPERYPCIAVGEKDDRTQQMGIFYIYPEDFGCNFNPNEVAPHFKQPRDGCLCRWCKAGTTARYEASQIGFSIE